jgi:hypothetical protein
VLTLSIIPDWQKLTVAIAVWRKKLNKTLLYSSCATRRFKTEVWSTPAQKLEAQRIDKTDLFHRQIYVAEHITVTGITVNISKLHVGMSHGIKIWGR